MDLSALNAAIAAVSTAETNLNQAGSADDQAQANLSAATAAAKSADSAKADAVSKFNNACDDLIAAATASKVPTI